MDCPKCKGDIKVLDTRPDGEWVHRRRECLACGHRFTTIEVEVSALRGPLTELARICSRDTPLMELARICSRDTPKKEEAEK